MRRLFVVACAVTKTLAASVSIKRLLLGTELAADGELTAEHVRQITRDGQAARRPVPLEASVGRAVGLLKCPENGGMVSLGDADARVAHAERVTAVG